MEAPFTLTFDVFWQWLAAHANCILRGGTLDSALYDDEDLHWHFAQERDGLMVVQLVRGKRLIGELFLDSERIDYVQSMPSQTEGEYMFELISEEEANRVMLYFFVLAHAYEEEPGAGTGSVH